MIRLLLVLLFMSSTTYAQFKHPATPSRPVTHDLHGIKLTDPYEWLEDKSDEEVVAWTRKQHDATVSHLKSLPAVEGLREEIEAYIDRDVIGPVFLRADRQFFYMKKKGEQQYSLYTRLDGEDIKIFDPHPLDEEGKASISGVAFSEDASVAAVGVQFKGDEISDYFLIRTKDGKRKGDPVKGLRGFSFTKDSKHAYVVKASRESIEAQQPNRTYLHKIGSDPEKDIFLGAPSDAKDVISFGDSKYADVTWNYEGDFYSTTVRIRPVGTDEDWTEIYSSKEYKAYGEAIGEQLYFWTNHEAPNYKIMTASLAEPGFENWTELVPESETVIEAYEVTRDYLLVQDKKDVLSRLLLHDHQGDFLRQIELPEVGNVSSMSYHRESNTLFVNVATFTAPAKVYTLDLESFEWTLFFERENPINTDEIEARIEFYESKDGTRVPIFILHRKDLERNGDNPCIVYGYGGFNIGISPSFVGLNATFINRGGVYAIAGIRGGDEYGESWHRDGMLFNKQNTFDDFIAAAEYMISEGYTNNNRLACKGGSNGGLLVGAVMTQRPDLYKAVSCGVPLLDMVRFHKFLIARYWIPEYGDPDDPAAFRNILEYSPYHNVRTGIDHPTVMIRAGENDTRVDPLHAKKFAARLQNNPGQQNDVMLYIDYGSGHGSGKSTDQVIEDYELEMRWLMNELGMINP